MNLPSGSTIVSAWLFYSATQANGAQNVASSIYSPISFTAPSGKKTSITPLAVNVNSILDSDPPNYTGTQNTYYHASIDVTNLMEGSGSYTIGGVPGCLGRSVSDTFETNYAGWSIVIAYLNESLPMRNITIWDVFDIIRGGVTANISLVGFATPPLGYPLSGKLFFSVGSGDGYIAGDQAMFGPDYSSLTVLSGPYNASGNFFQAQINDDNGNLSTTGTFGTRNQPFASSGASGVSEAARQGWDKTAIDISSLLQNNQTSAAIRLSSTQDLYFPQTAATEINLMSAVLNPTKSVTPSTALVGDTLTYKITLANTGQEPAFDVNITDAITSIASNVSFVPGSLTVNGSPTAYNPVTGFTLPGPYATGTTVTIEFKVLVNAMPVPNPFTNVAVVKYSYIPSAGGEAIIVEELTNPVIIRILEGTRGIAFI